MGHADGHDTPEYYNMLKVLDGYIAQIVEAVKEAGILDDTIFIVTSDHGGIKKDMVVRLCRKWKQLSLFPEKESRKGMNLQIV